MNTQPATSTLSKRLQAARAELISATERGLPEEDTWEENGLNYYRHQVKSLELTLQEAQARESRAAAALHGVSLEQSLFNSPVNNLEYE